MDEYISRSKDKNNIVTLSFCKPKHDSNTIDKAFLKSLSEELDYIAKDSEITGLIFTSSKQDFISGYTITELNQIENSKDAASFVQGFQKICDKISNLSIPTVAAIRGACLGCGLDIALACSWRICTNEPLTQLGFPEISLGLIPGGGGTHRLPQVIGLQAALDMILTGRKVSGKKALKSSLIDACVPPTLLHHYAGQYAQKPRKRRGPGIGSSSTLSKDLPKWAIEGNPIGRKVMYKKTRDIVDEKTKGFYPASYKALEAVFDGYEISPKDAGALASKLFGELLLTRQSQGLLHLINSEENTGIKQFKNADQERFADQGLKCVGVVGAGQMGTGICTICADIDLRVCIADPSKDAIGRALKFARSYFSKKVDRRKMQTFELQKKMAHISPGLESHGYQNCDLVIEAVFEDLELKQKTLIELEKDVSEDWIFASNTSAIPIKKIAKVAQRPERVIGMHFFAPVEKMPLLEVIVTEETADWATARVIKLGQELGKHVIVVKDSPGFYTTRTLAYFLAEALKILSEGSSVETIDKAVTDFGFPNGPLALIDEIGIDVTLHVLKTVGAGFDQVLMGMDILERISHSGRLGRKNKKGFYLYQDDERTGVDPDIYKLCQQDTSNTKPHENDEIIERCLMIFVNESVSCLEEHILAKASDGDIGAVYGLGFPPFWGGPFKYVDFLGAHHVVEVLNRLTEKYGKRFQPATLLKEYAIENKKFFPDEPWKYARN
ncbi:MAG: enoyl-CoA hydratase/isomerase family protein [Oligoflexales bacterium]|nr:enoyl-CoA hydratase/isomerase family protein [Oligoflexales bacterium]